MAGSSRGPRPGGVPRERPGPALPLWPLFLMFALVPLWWLLGGLYLLWWAPAVVMAVLLVHRGRVVLPTGSMIWLLLMGLIVVSATRLDEAIGLLGYGLRLSFIGSAFVVYLYVYNAARSGAAWYRLFRPLCWFWLAIVALGWVAVLAPTFTMSTVVEMLLPPGIAESRMMQALTHIHATEFRPASRNPYYRTAAPYPYTNNWGTGFAILVPCMLAYLTSVRGGALRFLVLISMPLALIPAFLTLNRGMFIGLGAGLLYLGLRALFRGDLRLIASIIVVTLLGWLATLVVPVDDLIINRVDNTDSTRDRLDLYLQTLAAVGHSPLLGYGGPVMVDTTYAAEPLGTQGQLWLIMYSHGVPALCVLLAFLLVVARRLSAAVSPAGTWLSTIPVITLVVTPFYGYTDINLSVMFFAMALALAAVDGPLDRRHARRRAPAPTRPPAPAGPDPTHGNGGGGAVPTADTGTGAAPRRGRRYRVG